MLKKYVDIIIAFLIFLFISITEKDFYHIVIMLLEFIVIIEVIQMIFVFLKRERIKIRYMVDVSIIYILRELLIAVTHKPLEYKELSIYIALVLVLFFIRYLAITVTYKAEKGNL